MNQTIAQRFGLLALFIVCLAGCTFVGPSLPDHVPQVETELDLSDVFAANPNVGERREHARALAEVFAIAASSVQRDGAETDAERVFTSGASVDDHIVRVRKLFTEHWSFADRYPQLGKVVGTYMKERLGKEFAGPLEAQRRADWIQVLREVEASARQI